MRLLLGTLKIALACVALWAGIAWFGTGTVALALALLASVAGFMGLDSANRHSAELQGLRERLRDIAESRSASDDRLLNRSEELEERIRRLDRRVDALTPTLGANDY